MARSANENHSTALGMTSPRSGIGSLGALLRSEAPEAFPLRVIDIGAANRVSATPPHLRPAVSVLAIEPDREAWPPDQTADHGFASVQWIEDVIGAEEAEVPFHLAVKRELSSILRPNFDVLRDFEGTERFEIERTATARMVPLDTVTRRVDWPRTDVLKIDVQGATGPVIDGGAKAMSEALLLIGEFELLELYEGQRLAWTCLEQVRRSGLDVIDLRPIRWLRSPNRVRGQAHGQTVFLNVLAARPVKAVAEQGPEGLLRLAFVMSVYGFGDLALAAIDASAIGDPNRFGNLPERARRMLRFQRSFQGRGSTQSWHPL